MAENNKGKDASVMTEKDTEVSMTPNRETSIDHGVQTDNEAPSPDIEYPGTLKLSLLMISVVLAIFICSLDTTIVSTAIPSITDEFNSLQDEAWYGSGFFMTMAAFQSSWGKAYKYFNIKTTFLLSIVVFELGSLICALAPSSTALIVGRAVAGCGAAGGASGVYLIVGISAPPERTPALLGIAGAVFGTAAVVGPLLGGVLTQRLGWRWCFWSGVTVAGILLFFSTPAHAKPTHASALEKLLQLDLVGTAIILGALVTLVLGLQWGGVSKPWSSGDVIGTLVASGTLFVLFAVVEIFLGERAAINIRLLRENKTVAILMAYQVILTGCFFIPLYFLPLFFQNVIGLDPAASGVRTIPLLAIVGVGAAVLGVMIAWTGEWQLPAIAGAALATVGAGLLYTLDAYSTTGQQVGYQIITGLGLGLTVQVAITVCQSVVDPEDLSITSAMALFFQLVGGAILIGVAQSVFANRLIRYIAAQLHVDPAVIVATGASGGRSNLSGEVLDTIIEGYTLGLRDVYILTITLGGISLIILTGSLVFDRRKMSKGLTVPAAF